VSADGVTTPSVGSATASTATGALGGFVGPSMGVAIISVTYPVYAVRRTADEVALDYDDRETELVFGQPN
jgi:hypothetical protein